MSKSWPGEFVCEPIYTLTAHTIKIHGTCVLPAGKRKQLLPLFAFAFIFIYFLSLSLWAQKIVTVSMCCAAAAAVWAANQAAINYTLWPTVFLLVAKCTCSGWLSCVRVSVCVRASVTQN